MKAKHVKEQFVIMQADNPILILQDGTTEAQAQEIVKRLNDVISRERKAQNNFYADSPTFLRVKNVLVYENYGNNDSQIQNTIYGLIDRIGLI